ncbi:glycoside hydrolase family 76 protein [Dothistroma septosporum NZE10]|uniref:Mannan endo-1,6-alpha-mannosidase n=1 Tax=Dothistroma septosporum (strain NZE10 / CBS 128990) TaxID=675120 RepID=M2YI12_DOTSN|nr:glycoside hydrolase family 76 protein [Dothistroma septosporum NZE10]
MRFLQHTAVALTAAASTANALTVDPTDADSIKSAAKTIATKMVAYYPQGAGSIPGLLGDPYYWWEAGEMFGSLIDYWYYTGDDQFNTITTNALLYQLSSTYDYMPANQSKDEGNDDQIFWGFAAMNAAEYRYPNPPDSQPAWISIAAAVFNSQALRWDTSLCAGGLRWQIYSFNNGYNYKNSPSNAGFINIASRLYAYTGNETYAYWVGKTWDWMDSVGLISSTGQVFDGTDALQNCSSLDHIQWTYSAGMLLNAAAFMYNQTNGTEQAMWESRANTLWTESSQVFFKNQVMFEVACEPSHNCNIDQQSFKAPFSRFLAVTMKLLPSLYSQILPYLQASAKAAGAQCSGGTDSQTCGTSWLNNGVWDGTNGVGQQMSALEVIQANLIGQSPAPVTFNTGGISQGNASLGTTGGTADGTPVVYGPVTTADKAGAAILTIVMVVGALGGGYFVVS